MQRTLYNHATEKSHYSVQHEVLIQSWNSEICHIPIGRMYMYRYIPYHSIHHKIVHRNF